MSTIRLYRDSRYSSEGLSEITGIRHENGKDVVACDRTVFFPGGGGQPCDTGYFYSDDMYFRIAKTYDEDPEGDIWHVTDADEGTFSEGDKVWQILDWDRRFTGMQRHLGEHILSGTIANLFKGENRGFHMGEDYVTIDIYLDGRMLTDEELLLAEKKANEAIRAKLPVYVDWFDTYEESLIMPLRKKVPHPGRVSVVTVGSRRDPYDCVACCGVHPYDTSEVAILSIYKNEAHKGMNRIYFDCGMPAFNKLSEDSRLLANISKKYSCSPHDLEDRLALEEKNISGLKEEAALMSGYIKDAEMKRVLTEIPPAGPEGAAFYSFTSDVLNSDDTLKLGFSIISETEGTVLLITHPKSLTCFLFSSSNFDCGSAVKALAPRLGGKGGGRKNSARAVFGNIRNMNSFVDDVREIVYNDKK